MDRCTVVFVCVCVCSLEAVLCLYPTCCETCCACDSKMFFMNESRVVCICVSSCIDAFV